MSKQPPSHNLMGYRAVTFDAAGTLLRPRDPVGDGYALVGRDWGIHLDPDAAERAFRETHHCRKPPHYPNGKPSEAIDRAWWKSLVFEVLTRCGQDPPADDRWQRYFDAVFAYYADPEVWTLYPEVPETLDALKATGLRLGVLSNFDRRLRPILGGLGVIEQFDAIVLSSESGVAKPHRHLFDRAAEALSTPPSACLHVGDDPVADWEGARNSGFQVFELVRPENSLADLPSHHSDS